MSSDIVRVVLADDEVIVRCGLKMVLGVARDFAVIAETDNGRDLLALVARFSPDVVVLELALPGLDGLAVTREIATHHGHTRVLVFTRHAEEEYLPAALDAGASGYLVKTATEREVVDAVHALAHGEHYVQPRAARLLATRSSRNAPDAPDRARLHRLTGREQQVLQLIAEGYSATDVGTRLAISPKTVDTYKQRIEHKLGMAGRPEYVQFALRVGLLEAYAHASNGNN
jgi:DNA-binding NarL/FixJ family response regulator